MTLARNMTVGLTADERASLASVRMSRSRKAFTSARRHTVLVRLLRRAIPVGAVVAVLGIVVLPFIGPFRGIAGVSMSSVGVQGGKVRMEAPRLSGYRKDNRPYEVTADSALQDIRNPTQIELSALLARIQMEREGWVTVTAKTGHFDTQAEKLRLVDDVRVRTETGYDIHMRTADIDFKGGTVASREPVKVSLGTTTIDADTLDVKDNGALISFDGRVKAVIENAPAGTLAGPEREGSRPDLDALKPRIDAEATQPER